MDKVKKIPTYECISALVSKKLRGGITAINGLKSESFSGGSGKKRKF